VNKTVFSRDEFLPKAGIARETLDEWLKWKIIRPAGYDDAKAPLFAQEALERAAHVGKLKDLGYGLEEIQKIVKKVGLPLKEPVRKKAPAKESFLTVGDLAERTAVSPRTIKHWEDKGIIEPDMRTEGGFRLYSEGYVFLCKLILDLQLFGYTLEEIKVVSDHFRDFRTIEEGLNALPKPEVEAKLGAMLKEIQVLFDKMKLLEAGIDRWEDLLKKKKKDILSLRDKNQKRAGGSEGGKHV